MITYAPATPDTLELHWNTEIAENLGDARYIAWKQDYMHENASGKYKTFYAFDDAKIIGQVTLVLHPDTMELDGQTELANNDDIAHICGLRVYKEYEGKSIASGLMRYIYNWARGHGIRYMTIGVEPHETRNVEIYTHWGFAEFVKEVIEKYPPRNENDSGEEVLVHYYKKKIQ